MKNNEKLAILANVCSLIFDYSSINDFYELFDNPEKSHPKYDMASYYKDVRDYVNSPDFENDSRINSFIGDVADTVYGVLRYGYYPTFLLYPKYDFERDILFHFVPNWIADDFDVLENADDTCGEIINHVLNDFNDFVTEFFFQVFQNGDDYSLTISHSNKYSQKMINDFKDTYISILSNIINASMSCDLSSTLK